MEGVMNFGYGYEVRKRGFMELQPADRHES